MPASIAASNRAGFSGAAPGNDYAPEFLTSYVAGVRNRFLDNKLQVNLEGFTGTTRTTSSRSSISTRAAYRRL
jgi:hypothetical protein